MKQCLGSPIKKRKDSSQARASKDIASAFSNSWTRVFSGLWGRSKFIKTEVLSQTQKKAPAGRRLCCREVLAPWGWKSCDLYQGNGYHKCLVFVCYRLDITKNFLSFVSQNSWPRKNLRWKGRGNREGRAEREGMEPWKTKLWPLDSEKRGQACFSSGL